MISYNVVMDGTTIAITTAVGDICHMIIIILLVDSYRTLRKLI